MASSAEPQKTFAEKLQHECSDLLKLALTASEEVYYPSWKTIALEGHYGSTEGDYAGLRVYPMGHYKVLVVAVVGTTTVEQWHSNITFSPAEDGFHEEFERCGEEVWKALGEAVQKRAENCDIVLIVGHSRGAAIALNLFGQAVVHQAATSAFKEKLHLITFASPRTCKPDSDFESKIKEAAKKVKPEEGLESMVAIFHNKLDPVTKAPLHYVLPVPAKCIVSIGLVIDSPDLAEHHLMPKYRINAKQHLRPSNWVVCTGAVKMSASVAQTFLTVAPLIGLSLPALAPAGVMLELLSKEKQGGECLKQLEMQIKHGIEKLQEEVNNLVEREVKKDLSLLHDQFRQCYLELQCRNINRQSLRDIEVFRNNVKFHLQNESERAQQKARLAARLLETFTLEVRCWLHLNDAQKFETLPGTIRNFLTDVWPTLDNILCSGHIEKTLEIAIMDFFNLLLGLPKILDKSMDDFGVNGENDIFQNLFHKYDSKIREKFWDAVLCRESLQLCWDHQEKVDKVEEMISQAAASTSKLPTYPIFEEQKKVLQDLYQALFPESEEREERYLDRLCLRACISGETNAGKSTLVNALSGKVVSPISHSGNTVLPMTLMFLGNRNDFHITIKAPFLKYIPMDEGLGIKEEKPGIYETSVQDEKKLQQVLVGMQDELRDKMNKLNKLNKEETKSEVFDHIKPTDEIIIEMPGDFRPLTLTDVPGSSEGGPMGEWMRRSAEYQKKKAHLELRVVDAGSSGVETYIKKTEKAKVSNDKGQRNFLLLVNKVKDDKHIEEIKKKFQDSKKDHKNVYYTRGQSLLALQLIQTEKELLGPLSESEIANEHSAAKKKLLYQAAVGDVQNHEDFVEEWKDVNRRRWPEKIERKCSGCDNFALLSFLETAASQHWAKCSERLLQEAAMRYDEMARTCSINLDMLKGKFGQEIEMLEEFLRLKDQKQLEDLKKAQKYKKMKKQLEDGIKILQKGTTGWQSELLRNGWDERCVEDLAANVDGNSLPKTRWSSSCQNLVCEMMLSKLFFEEEEENAQASLVLDPFVALRLATSVAAVLPDPSSLGLAAAAAKTAGGLAGSYAFLGVTTQASAGLSALAGSAFGAGAVSTGMTAISAACWVIPAGAALASLAAVASLTPLLQVSSKFFHSYSLGTWGEEDLSSEIIERKILEFSLKLFKENAPKTIAKCKELKAEDHKIAALEREEARWKMKAAALRKFAKATFGLAHGQIMHGFAIA